MGYQQSSETFHFAMTSYSLLYPFSQHHFQASAIELDHIPKYLTFLPFSGSPFITNNVFMVLLLVNAKFIPLTEEE